MKKEITSEPIPKTVSKNAVAVAAAAKTTPTIVGIGASAGGLEALEEFLTHVPASSGVAFVVIQHLDPTHKGMMPELLQRVTPMKVMQAGNRMKVKPNCVYVIPPNKDLSILRGSLFLLDPIAARGLRLPIDFFFHALAADQHERSVGIILSGMGSDGTLGLRAIKANAGLSMVQSPKTAKFDSMPSSAIDAKVADIVAPAKELPERLLAYLNHPHLNYSPGGISPAAEPILKIDSHNALAQIIILLRQRNGNDFSLYKNNTINRRIERRMGLHQIEKIAFYVRYLRENPQELDLLFKELLIGVTNFFRDPQVWEQLRTKALPTLFAKYPAGKEMRAWVSACSTGEEACSLAMTFKEALDELKPQGQFSLQIFATDLDADAVAKARLGFYPANIEDDLSPQRIERFFVKEGNGYRINNEIREMVIFAPQNIIMDPPFTRLDILTCRNLLIYFGSELQNRLIPLFHYALTSHGILLLGTSETVGSFTSLFNPIENKSKIYNRIDTPLSLAEIDFPVKLFPVTSEAGTLVDTTLADTTQSMKTPTPNLQGLADQILLQNYAPAAVMVTAEGDILYINGRTGKYLEPAAGKANWNLYAMAREGLRHVLGMAMKKAQGQVEPVHVPNLTIGTNGGTQTIKLTVQLITTPKALSGSLMVIFTDVLPPGKSRRKPPTADANQKAMQDENQLNDELMRSMREEMQSSQEELKSANEELQSTNEELQSTNEELTTSKEEMQSLNEELQTVNTELQSKVEDLSWVNNDMENLLNSTEIATVFLDNSLYVRRFTDQATQLFKLIPGDVGRPLSDVANDLDYAELQKDAKEVLKTLVFIEKQVTTNDARWFKVRIMPYRTQDNLIDGVVITFFDITERERADATVRKALAVLQSRYKDQSAELITANALETVLNTAQSVLEQRFKDQSAELTTANALETVMITAKTVLEQRFKDQTTELNIANALETTLNTAQSVLEQRFKDQTTELNTANALETTLNTAQSKLEKRFKNQTAELGQAKADLKSEQSKNN